ncbi:MAG: YihY/virulence factor BrkB family protein [Rhodospirillales bacterium]
MDDLRYSRPAARMTWADWKLVLRHCAAEVATDRVSLVAAGCAFYATLALFPAISMVIALYGLMFDPQTVVPHLALLQTLLPSGAFDLIADRVRALVRQPQATLTFGLVLGFAITTFSAAAGTRSILGALNLAYGAREQRRFLAGQAVALGLTLGGMVAAALCIALLVLLPASLSILGTAHDLRLLVQQASLALLLVFVMGSVTLLYRIGPSRRPPSWRFILPGVGLATLLWLAASALYSWYVAHLAGYDLTYGPLGAVVGLMMWFYVSALAVLVGAELNAALEWQVKGTGLSGGRGGGESVA